MKDFENLEKIKTKTFKINGITYSTKDVRGGRFTRIIADCEAKGKLHVEWTNLQSAYIDEYGNSVDPSVNFKARLCRCSGFLFEEKNLSLD